jgi:hypothetical protein
VTRQTESRQHRRLWQGVFVGQNFLATGSAKRIWQIVQLVEKSGVPHAVIVALDDPFTHKTVSIHGLTNPAQFRPN